MLVPLSWSPRNTATSKKDDHMGKSTSLTVVTQKTWASKRSPQTGLFDAPSTTSPQTWVHGSRSTFKVNAHGRAQRLELNKSNCATQSELQELLPSLADRRLSVRFTDPQDAHSSGAQISSRKQAHHDNFEFRHGTRCRLFPSRLQLDRPRPNETRHHGWDGLCSPGRWASCYVSPTIHSRWIFGQFSPPCWTWSTTAHSQGTCRALLSRSLQWKEPLLYFKSARGCGGVK